MSNPDRPNILWYCTDQQRYDTIRGLGNYHINTPNFDRFMGAGTAFTQAYCQSQICTPSRASFLTGRYPASNHVHRNGNAYFPPNEKLVTRMLADAGYDPVYGARPLKRVIQRSLQNSLAGLILEGAIKDGDQVLVSADDAGLTINGAVASARVIPC